MPAWPSHLSSHTQPFILLNTPNQWTSVIDLNPPWHNKDTSFACSLRRGYWSWQTTRPGCVAVVQHISPLVLQFSVMSVNRSLLCVAMQELNGVYIQWAEPSQLTKCLFKQRVGRGEGGRESVMINPQRGPWEPDSITSLHCSSVGKVRLSIGGQRLPLSLQGRKN